jgi:hypothetical protein
LISVELLEYIACLFSGNLRTRRITSEALHQSKALPIHLNGA